MARRTKRSLHYKCIYAVGYTFVKVQEEINLFINHQKKMENGGVFLEKIIYFFLKMA